MLTLWRNYNVCKILKFCCGFFLFKYNASVLCWILNCWLTQSVTRLNRWLKIVVMLYENSCYYVNLDFPYRLKGLEQITKATMLGHLLPVLLTSLMHPNLQTLTMADALMPQLVQLVLYTSQVGSLCQQLSAKGKTCGMCVLKCCRSWSTFCSKWSTDHCLRIAQQLQKLIMFNIKFDLVQQLLSSDLLSITTYSVTVNIFQ